jgi:hypothetical protein
MRKFIIPALAAALVVAGAAAVRPSPAEAADCATGRP